MKYSFLNDREHNRSQKHIFIYVSGYDIGIFIFLQFLEPAQFKVIEQSLGVDRDF